MKKNQYTVTDGTCLNSGFWIAKFLALKNQEYCQCPFECKIKVTLADGTGRIFIISGTEYKKLKKNNQIT